MKKEGPREFSEGEKKFQALCCPHPGGKNNAEKKMNKEFPLKDIQPGLRNIQLCPKKSCPVFEAAISFDFIKIILPVIQFLSSGWFFPPCQFPE